jgi:ATP-dependent 26S proteasome regulatory subunit
LWSPVSLRSIDIAEPKPVERDYMDFFKMVKAFKDNVGTDKEQVSAVLCLCDAGHLLSAPNNLRLLRETLWSIRGSNRTIIFMGHPFEIPPQIAPDLNVQTFELPTAKELQIILEPSVAAWKKVPAFAKLNIDMTMVPKFARACAGLTEIETRGLLGFSVARYEAFDARAVDLALQEKAQIVKRSNVLEYKVCHGGLDSVGGLQNVKNWIKEQDDIFKDADAARAAGQKLSKGLLLIGCPGTGKSLMAEMLPAHWSIPLLEFDVGRAFGSLIGQSESNIDQMISLAKACAPCVVAVDEIEKALGGGGGEMDGGTSARVKGKLLTWLQEKPDDVFVVATANDVTKFESSPELIRAGRFDLVAFVDLPDFKSRLEILAIKYKQAVEYAKSGATKSTLKETLSADTIMAAAQASRGYSGAELEVIVQRALRFAFNAKPRLTQPTSEMFLAAVKAVKPLSLTMEESIKALRAWAADGRAVPAGATIEDDKDDVKALENEGLPQLLK